LPNSTIFLGSDEGYSDAGVMGLQDPFPTTILDSTAIRRLTETRMCALANVSKIQAIGVPSWNDVVFAHRRIYAAPRALGSAASNLLFAYSPIANNGYDLDGRGVTTGTTDTDETGKTVTLPTSATWDGGRTAIAATPWTAPLPAGTLDNLAWVTLMHGENSAPGQTAAYLYLRYTDANNWLRLYRIASGTVRLEKNVASVTTTEADFNIATTEPYDGSAYAVRINGTLVSVFANGLRLPQTTTLLQQVTLSAGAQALTGLLVGGATTAARGSYGETEVWSTADPYYTK
jgi:hypothetical protein